MSYTDAPIPNTPEARFGAWKKGTDERLNRMEQPSTTPPDIPIPIVGAQLDSGFLITPVPGAGGAANLPRYRSTIMRRPYKDCVEVKFTITTPAATTAVTQLRDAITGTQTPEFGIAASTTAVVWYRWLHGLNTEVASASNFQLEIRSGRSAGAGTVNIFMPDQCLFISSNLLDPGDADANGNPQLI